MPNLAITGALLILPDGPRRLTLRVVGDRIATLGGSPQPGDRVLDLTGHAVFPGLINAHEQLDLNIFPRVKLRECYDHARDWYADMRAQMGAPGLAELRAIPASDRMVIGGLKNLLTGTTTVLHHGQLHRGLTSHRFPVRVVERFGWAHSLFAGQDIEDLYARTPPDAPFVIRIAEGTDIVAAHELGVLAAKGCLGANTVLVHGTGLSSDDVKRIEEAGAGLVWCPQTDRYLLGMTHFRAGLERRMALGTASRMTGALDLLEELKAAADESHLPAERVLRLVLDNAARLLHLPDAGRLAHEARADLIVIANDSGDPFATLLAGHRADLRLVMLGGRPQIADADLSDAFDFVRVAAVPATLDDVPKLIARDLARTIEKTELQEPGLSLL